MLQETWSQHSQHKGDDCPPISEDDIWSQVVGGPYKGCIYRMGTYYSSGSMSPAFVTGSFAVEDHEVWDRVHALSFELQNCAQWFQKAEACHKKEMKKLRKENKHAAFMHHMPAGNSSNVPFPHLQIEESSGNSSLSGFDLDDLATHDADPNANPMDPDYH